MVLFQLWVSPLAKSDIKNILNYGDQNWGKERAKKYKNDLKGAFWSLTQYPLLGVERSEVMANLRCLVVRQHVIFYRLNDKSIEILRVLHGRQDPETYL